MFLEYNYYNGKSPSSINEGLLKTLSAYNQHHGYNGELYVGFTGNLEQRFERHKTAQWKKMVVVYRSWSMTSAVDVENRLIKYGQDSDVGIELKNIKGVQDISKRYVYLLTDRREKYYDGPKSIDCDTWIEWENKCKTGPLDARLIVGVLKGKLSRCINKEECIYIGMTNDPKRRWREHQRKRSRKWDQMHLLYSTTSLGNAKTLENILIKYADQNIRPGKCSLENVLIPKDGGKWEPPVWHVYILIP